MVQGSYSWVTGTLKWSYRSVMMLIHGSLHVRLLVANCTDEQGQTDRQKDRQTDRQTDR